MSFVYFVPGTDAKWREVVAYAFDGNPPTAKGIEGPAGVGTMFARDANAIRYVPSEQEWIDRGDGVWIGRDKGRGVRPADLARKVMVPGVAMSLADGQEWLVPRLRMYLADAGFVCALPTRMRRAKGEWLCGAVRSEWAAADILATELLNRMLTAQATTGAPDATVALTYADAASLASRVLSVNYYVSEDELGMLEVLATDQLVPLLRAAIDWETAELDALGKLLGRDA